MKEQIEQSTANESKHDTATPLNLRIVEYSSQSIAVFGDSRAIKDQLKALGGKFNKYLKDGELKVPGWIFKISMKADVEKLIEGGSITESQQTENNSANPANLKRKNVEEIQSNNASQPNLRIVEYSAQSIVVFGDSRAIKDQLKALGGKYNKYLKDGELKVPGWIFQISKKADVEKLILEEGLVATVETVDLTSAASVDQIDDAAKPDLKRKKGKGAAASSPDLE